MPTTGGIPFEDVLSSLRIGEINEPISLWSSLFKFFCGGLDFLFGQLSAVMICQMQNSLLLLRTILIPRLPAHAKKSANFAGP